MSRLTDEGESPEVVTEQAKFWQGSFGADYIDRNSSAELLASNIHLFSRILRSMTARPNRVLELGANIGMNYFALQHCLPGVQYSGVEVNEQAWKQLAETGAEAFHDSIESFDSEESWDLVFTKGVLIHLNPESLHLTYEKMSRLSKKYVLIAEYFNPSPVSIDYRGESEKLFKRDFAGEMLDSIPSLGLVDYGFVWSRGSFPQDDITWFLLERR
jgi:pseudaminic acid biosynthesis-associated methylase